MGYQHPTITAIPDGYELITRTAIVRLGVGGPTLHTDGNHSSLGVTGVSVEGSNLVVHTDCSVEEEILHAQADVDATLAKKGVFAGVSGGGSRLVISIYSCRDLPYGAASKRTAFTALPPNSGVFDHAIDNLWVTALSLRPLLE